MATAKRVSELQALSFSVSFQGEDLVLYYDPFFRAKTESVTNPLPRSVVVPSLSDFAGNLPERLHCPVRAIKYLRKAARSASFIPSRLFVSPKNPKRSMSKMPCHFILGNLLLTVVLYLPPVHLELMTFVALPLLSTIIVISLLPALCK